MAYLRFNVDHGTAIIHNQVAYKRSNGQPSLGVIDTYWGVNDSSWSSYTFAYAEPGGRTSWTDQQVAVANLNVHMASITCSPVNNSLKSMYTAPTNGTFRVGKLPSMYAPGDHVYYYINNVNVGSLYIGALDMGWKGTGGEAVPINVNAGDVVGIQSNGSGSIEFTFVSRFLPNVYPY